MTLHHGVTEIFIICCVATENNRGLPATRRMAGAEAGPLVLVRKGGYERPNTFLLSSMSRWLTSHSQHSRHYQGFPGIYQLNEKHGDREINPLQEGSARGAWNVAFAPPDYGRIYEGGSVGVSVSWARSILLAQEQSSPSIRFLVLGIHLQNVVMRNTLSNAYLSAKLHLNGQVL